VLAKSVTPSRIDANMKLITLDDEDMEHLEKISKTKGLTRFVYPAFGVGVSSLFLQYTKSMQLIVPSIGQLGIPR
jgi:hypothetical protein